MMLTSISYISKILWRFYGGANLNDPQAGINDIQYIFEKDRIVLQPYKGADGKSDKYKRQVVFKKEGAEKSITHQIGGQIIDDPDIKVVYVEEPKAVCFCDIPINHLALHMRKYGHVGLGIDKNLLTEKALDLQPVRYYFIREPKEYNHPIPGIFNVAKSEGQTRVQLEKYVKIPTLFQDDGMADKIKQPDNEDKEFGVSECFDWIYEEREWRHFGPVTLKYEEISFLLFPSRKYLYRLGKLSHLVDAKVGIIYTDELFPSGEK